MSTSGAPDPVAGLPGLDSGADSAAAESRRAMKAAQEEADAALAAQFDAGGEGAFDYTASVDASRNMTLAPQQADASVNGTQAPPGRVDPAAGMSVTAYLAKMQRGGQVQSFGCMMLLQESTFTVLAYSENAPKMLGLLEPPPTPLARSPSRSVDLTSVAVPQGKASSAPLSHSSTKKKIGSALRSLSIKISNAISHNRSRGKVKDQATPGAAVEKAASAPSSPRLGKSNNEATTELSCTSSAPSSPRWNLLRMFSSAHSSPSSSPRHPAAGADAVAAPAPAPEEKAVPRLALGASALSLFTPDSAEGIRKAALSQDVSMMNPLLVQTAGSGDVATQKPFYAIFHRTSAGLHVDLEPIRPEDPIFMGEGALQAHRLAAKAIAKLQRVPAGHLKELCGTVAQEVRELTGYDRVMCYKFHEDEHGEVLGEAKREDMEAYMGLHYPATDIPQAARILFMKNRVRIIVNCEAPNSKVLQDERALPEPIELSNSTLRAVHGCHAQYMKNMGTLGSIGMAIVVKDPDAKEEGARRLWGLVVCHHEEPRYLPYPIRLACEFLMQVFSMKVNMEIEVAVQEKETEMLRTQTLLCDMLQRDAPVGIMTQYPNIMDLVKCDGAALLYNGKFWVLGTTPAHGQMRDIVRWLQEEHGESSGFSTDSLRDSGYPKAEELGENVCGMIAAQLLGEDYLFWFRSPVEKEVVWSGAKHQPGEKDDGRKMNPRSSFAAFLEVVRHRSTPWDDIEIDAVSSLVLILRGHLTSFSTGDLRAMEATRLNAQDVERLSIAESELSRMLETATAPVFTVDKLGCITAWNSKMAQLTGLTAGEALGMHLVGDLVKEEAKGAMATALAAALNGKEAKNIEVRLKKFVPRAAKQPGSGGGGRQSPGQGPALESTSEAVLLLNAFVSRGGLLEDGYADEEGDGMDEEPRTAVVTGVCFMGQDLTAQKMVEGHFTKVQGDYAAIVHSGNSLIPPIFAIDESGLCAEWNPAMEKLAGLSRDQALGQMLLGGVFGSALKMKAADRTKLMIVLNKGVSGHNTERYPLSFLSREGHLVEALLTVNSRRDTDGNVMGAFCFLHTASPELQAAIRMQRAAEEFAESKSKAVAYIRQEIKAPLDGLKFARSRMETWPQVEKSAMGQKAMETAVRCEQMLTRILGDDNVENLEDGYLGLESDDYRIEDVIDTVVSIGQEASSKKKINFECECREDISKKPPLCGDAMRFQQALADFVSTAVQFTPEGGWVTLRVITGARTLFADPHSLRIEFRVLHSGRGGLPGPIVQQMLESTTVDKTQMTQEGLGLSVSRKIIQEMGGDVQYDRLMKHSEFVVRMVLPYPQEPSSCATPRQTATMSPQPATLGAAADMNGLGDMQVDIISAEA